MNLHVSNLFDVSSKTALVTGATGYLGQIICKVLKDNGAYVIGMGRRETCGNVHEYISVDFQDENKVAELVNYKIDILVNNAHDMSLAAGFNVSGDQIKNRVWDEWERHITTAIRIPTLLTSIVAPNMKANGGSIINICTMYAQVAPSPLLYEDTPYMNPPGYGASKAALLEFTRYVAAFWGKHNIRCNAILPGPFPKSIVGMKPEFLQRLKDRTCLGRVGKAEELAGVVLFLASDASSYITGHALNVDAGWTVV